MARHLPGAGRLRGKAEDTEGCPLHGDYDKKKPDWVSNSRVRCEEFNQLVEKVGGEFDLIVC